MINVERLVPLRGAILDSWMEAIWSSYPADGGPFLKETGDPFANPVGASYRHGTERLLDGILADQPADEMGPELDALMRIRALQEMSPSRAVSIITWLKTAAREQAEKVNGDGMREELQVFDARVDLLLLAAFDAYMKCREEVFSIRIKEIQNRSLKVMERLNEWRSRRDGSDGESPAELES